MANFLSKEVVRQFIRFGIVGVLATITHYAIYWFLQGFINYNIAYTLGYIIAFVFNYLLTAFFTFQDKISLKNCLGFGGAHLCNYIIQMLLLNIVIYMGVCKNWAPLPVFVISVPVNFLMIKFVFNHGKK